MSKKTFLYLSLGAIVLFILAVILASVGASSQSASLALVGLLFYIVGGILAFILWIMGLIKTAKTKAWGWFVFVLLLTPLATLLYGIIAPAEVPTPVTMNR